MRQWRALGDQCIPVGGGRVALGVANRGDPVRGEICDLEVFRVAWCLRGAGFDGLCVADEASGDVQSEARKVFVGVEHGHQSVDVETLDKRTRGATAILSC